MFSKKKTGQILEAFLVLSFNLFSPFKLHCNNCIQNELCLQLGMHGYHN